MKGLIVSTRDDGGFRGIARCLAQHLGAEAALPDFRSSRFAPSRRSLARSPARGFVRWDPDFLGAIRRMVRGFHAVFVRCHEHGVRLHPNFVALGIHLAALYEHLETLDVPLDVRVAFAAAAS